MGSLKWNQKHMAQVDDSHMEAELKVGPVRMLCDSWAGNTEFIIQIEGNLPPRKSKALMEAVADLLASRIEK